MKFHRIFLETFRNVLILKCRIFAGFDCNAFKETAPELLVFELGVGVVSDQILIQCGSICNQKIEGPGAVDQCLFPCRVVDYKILLWQPVTKVFPQDGEDIIFRVNLGKQDAGAQFFKAQKAEQVVSFVLYTS